MVQKNTHSSKLLLKWTKANLQYLRYLVWLNGKKISFFGVYFFMIPRGILTAGQNHPRDYWRHLLHNLSSAFCCSLQVVKISLFRTKLCLILLQTQKEGWMLRCALLVLLLIFWPWKFVRSLLHLEGGRVGRKDMVTMVLSLLSLQAWT